ncbi:MAG: GxxExxY protein [Verrucomicrobiales bacterium]|nr:GxxExxY protein [Verrucomicrobiales bacterium]
MNLDRQELPHIIVGACMEVHRHLGPGLNADAYKECLAHELRMREVLFARDHKVDVCYKERWVEGVCRLDFLVENEVVVDVSCIDGLREPDKARMRNYLRLTGYEVGLLINFNVADLRGGIKRIIVSAAAPTLRYR